MRMMKLAYENFRSSFKSYWSLIVSLAFTVMIFMNFQNIVFSHAFDVLEGHNSEYINIIVEVFAVVLGCFMFFFIGYATNVFLTKRKKEIGTYVFMGLGNQKIAKLYLIEISLTGIAAFILGLALGYLTANLFQMILLALSDIAAPMQFHMTIWPAVITAAVYFAVYMLFAVKGYVNIVKSSVRNLLSASGRNEAVKQNAPILILKAILGVVILGCGYYTAVKDSGWDVMNYLLLAVALVCAGVYLLFGGLIPVLFKGLAGNKKYLYRKQRSLWVNHVVFRLKRNYRTYAIVCILALCAVTALAAGFAVKYRYERIVNFCSTYTFQFMTVDSKSGEKAEQIIEEMDTIAYRSQTQLLLFENSSHGIVSYTQMKRLAEEAEMDFPWREPAEDETICARHLVLLSLRTKQEEITVAMHDKQYRQTAETTIPYLGALQDRIDCYIVNDAEYARLRPLGIEFSLYNYKLADEGKWEEVREATDCLINMEKASYTIRIMVNPEKIAADIDWMKVLYSLADFLFMVFLMAAGSILFMRIYNDAFEEVQTYQTLQKLGYDGSVLRKSAACELGVFYTLPFLVMTVSSYFSVYSLERMMRGSDLFAVNVVSVLIVFAIFLLFYIVSIAVYCRNAGIRE